MNTHPNGDLTTLLEYLKQTRGFDFTGYKPTNLARRIFVRLQTLKQADYASYQDYLEVHPEEFTNLFNTILINVTAFFRDQAAWAYLQSETIPELATVKPSPEPIRVWSAGCASGEEAYTLAMVFAEALGPEEFARRVKIYATDVDEEALATARLATYPAKALEPVPEDLREKYFVPADGDFVVKTELRRAIIFGHHDLIQDAPISRLDLLVCRNTLMYFNAETQSRILTRFHFALADHGCLFLGRAEMMLTHGDLFSPTELGHRIFCKAPGGRRPIPPPVLERHENAVPVERLTRISTEGFNASPLAQIVVDAGGTLALANRAARAMFALAPTDLGRPIQDLELSYRPVDLRSLLDQVRASRRMSALPGVARPLPDGTTQYLDLQVTPLLAGAELLGVTVTFNEVTDSHRLFDELQRSQQELQAAYEQLQSTNEELETTNEELQSTNEELETTNEELETINTQVEERTREVDVLNAFLEAVLSSVRAGVIVMDKSLHVTGWNYRAEDLWGVRAEEAVGKPLHDLEIGLRLDKLPLATVLTGKINHQELDLDAVNRKGQTIRCHVTVSAFVSAEGERQGIVLLMEEMPI